jgi:tripartite-type tricarboxylate transporter receptor subunit TctC
MRLIRAVLAATLGVLAFAGAHAQVGEQPIRIVVPYPAGGAGDTTARMIAQSMRTSLQRPVIVENKPGAAGRLGVQAVKEAAPDGSVLLFTPIAPTAIFPHVYEKLAYGAVADFAPISQVATFDLAVAVGANVPSKSLKGLVAWLNENPAQASYGTPAAGSLPHFFAV